MRSTTSPSNFREPKLLFDCQTMAFNSPWLVTRLGPQGCGNLWAFRHLPVARIHQGVIKHAPLRLSLPLSILVLVQKFPEHMGPKSGALSMTGTGIPSPRHHPSSIVPEEHVASMATGHANSCLRSSSPRRPCAQVASAPPIPLCSDALQVPRRHPRSPTSNYNSAKTPPLSEVKSDSPSNNFLTRLVDRSGAALHTNKPPHPRPNASLWLFPS